MKQHILLKGLSLEQANHWEQHYIKIFDCMVPNGYNLTSGGSNCIISDETKKKMSISHKGKNIGKKRPPRTAEWCNNHSKSMTGKVRTAEHCSNISKAKKGKKRKPFTAEHRSNISKGLTGKKQPNVSKAMTGKKRKPFTAEHKSNMSLVHNRHETMVIKSLSNQLAWYEKRLEKQTNNIAINKQPTIKSAVFV